MEDWQEWQIRADQVAAALGQDIDVLNQFFLADGAEGSLRNFWPRYRDLKERVRTAPAIKLDDKLALERRLRDLGGRAYKAQEAAVAESSGHKEQLLASVMEFRAAAEHSDNPRELRAIRRDLDAVRQQFDAGNQLVSADRQVVWDAWREASQFVWERLTSMWGENELQLRAVLEQARAQLAAGDGDGARRSVGKFFEVLKTREARQNTINTLKAEATAIRNGAGELEERRASERAASRQTNNSNPVEGWKAELERTRELIARMSEDVAAASQQFEAATSILDQAMLRGTLVDKKQKLAELERSARTLEQRIDQSQETPLMMYAGQGR